MDRLGDALGRHRDEIQAALDAALREREELRDREQRLSGMIEQAQAALHEPSNEERLTLHQAIARVLEWNGNRWMHTREIAEEVNRRGLYTKRDGSPVESNQIHARTKNYTQLFEKDGPQVRLWDGREPVVVERSGPRSKYDALRRLLESHSGDIVTLSFDEIGEAVGGLPRSAWDHQAWWANEQSGSHVQARSWIGAGFRTASVDQSAGRVRFVRAQSEG